MSRSEEPAPSGAALGADRALTAAALAALAIGVASRVLRIDATELWLDEICSVLLADRDLPELWATLRTSEKHPPLFYLLLRAAVQNIGREAVAARLPSLVAGLACLGALYAAGRATWGRRAGLWAAALAALTPVVVHYSAEARHYMVAALFALLATEWLRRAHVHGRVSWWAGYVTWTALAMSTHYYAFFLLPLLPLSFLLYPRTRRNLALGATAGAVLAGLALAYILGLTAGGGEVSRALDHFWRDTGPLDAGLRSLALMAPGGALPDYLGHVGALRPPLWAQVLSAGVGACLLVAALRPGASPERDERRAVWLWAMHLALPIAIPLALSVLVRPVYLVGRYELLAWPAAPLLLAYGATAGAPLRARRWLGLAALLVFAACGATVLAPLAQIGDPRHRTKLAETLAGEARDGDLVVPLSLTGPLVRFHAGRLGRSFDYAWFPSDLERHGCWLNYAEAAADVGARDKDAAAVVARAKASSAKGAATWVVVPMDDKRRTVHSWPLNGRLLKALEQAGFVVGRRARVGEYAVFEQRLPAER